MFEPMQIDSFSSLFSAKSSVQKVGASENNDNDIGTGTSGRKRPSLVLDQTHP